mmetsp:Transcript_6465/g.15586  ORF Transcript_6465/g.15586 Transcript_6465/m.15586 type:complete len:354 (-) Transcript_6465:487-1548(-)
MRRPRDGCQLLPGRRRGLAALRRSIRVRVGRAHDAARLGMRARPPLRTRPGRRARRRGAFFAHRSLRLHRRRRSSGGRQRRRGGGRGGGLVDARDGAARPTRLRLRLHSLGQSAAPSAPSPAAARAARTTLGFRCGLGRLGGGRDGGVGGGFGGRNRGLHRGRERGVGLGGLGGGRGGRLGGGNGSGLERGAGRGLGRGAHRGLGGGRGGRQALCASEGRHRLARARRALGRGFRALFGSSGVRSCAARPNGGAQRRAAGAAERDHATVAGGGEDGDRGLLRRAPHGSHARSRFGSRARSRGGRGRVRIPLSGWLGHDGLRLGRGGHRGRFGGCNLGGAGEALLILLLLGRPP